MTSRRSGSMGVLISLVALGVAAYALVSARRSRSGEISAEEASAAVKRYAEDQQIRVELSEDQLDAIQQQWTMGDPAHPADITFVVEDRPEANLRVASYSYWGDTCCV